MIKSGIITKMDELTEWINNMVVIISSKILHICLDPIPLNEAILGPHYLIPTADSLIMQLQKSFILVKSYYFGCKKWLLAIAT